MGRAHAVFILMAINFAAIRKCFSIMRRSGSLFLLNDASVVAQGVELTPTSGAVYLHVDDLAVVTG